MWEGLKVKFLVTENTYLITNQEEVKFEQGKEYNTNDYISINLHKQVEFLVVNNPSKFEILTDNIYKTVETTIKKVEQQEIDFNIKKEEEVAPTNNIEKEEVQEVDNQVESITCDDTVTDFSDYTKQQIINLIENIKELDDEESKTLKRLNKEKLVKYYLEKKSELSVI